jgi:hypothetical protein
VCGGGLADGVASLVQRVALCEGGLDVRALVADGTAGIDASGGGGHVALAGGGWRG